MLGRLSPLAAMQADYASGARDAVDVARESLAQANANASRNSYINLDAAGVLDQARALKERFPEPAARPPLFGVPASLKDCFDLAGTVTTAGSRFYAEKNAPATKDSAMAARLKSAGAVVTGKTHLHPLAYGITGQNPDYRDCLQPRDASLLTGGSSSGAAASVQEGSALVAIGTDTGGSIRVPSVLCGLVGYRASHALAYADGPWPSSPAGLWAGGIHLARSFDTPGFLLRDPRDAAPVAEALFGLVPTEAPVRPRIGYAPSGWLERTGAEAEVRQGLDDWIGAFAQHASVTPMAEEQAALWSDSSEIFAAIQASEASRVHAGHFDQFPAPIPQRLHWGASLSVAELEGWMRRLAEFRVGMAALLAGYDLLVVPCSPIRRLTATEDQTNARTRILQYTTPFSLAGLPVVSLPGEIIGAPFGTGVQLVAPAAEDAYLLAFAAALGDSIASRGDS